jgi:hypothetical protein
MQAQETDSFVASLHVSEGQLWLVAVLGFVIGDVVTTSVGLGVAGVSEANPVAVHLFDHSLLAALAVKLGFVGGYYLLWWYASPPHRKGIPLSLAVLGVVVTIWNVHVIARAVFL